MASEDDDNAPHEPADFDSVQNVNGSQKNIASYSHLFPDFARQLPLEEHGLVGNMLTCALVNTHASIDWFCFPHFDSPSVFGCILDARKGGFWRISPGLSSSCPTGASVRYKQHYRSETNVLITRFLSSQGVAQVTDFMPVSSSSSEKANSLIRQVDVVRGRMYLEVEVCPAFNYGRDSHDISVRDDSVVFTSAHLCLSVTCTHPREWKPSSNPGAVHCSLDMVEGERTAFILRECRHSLRRKPTIPTSAAAPAYTPAPTPASSPRTGHAPFAVVVEAIEAPHHEDAPLSLEQCSQLLKESVRYWRSWLNQCTYKGRWREHVQRSLLALKLLTFEPTGAIVAAPTTSLPETIGGLRNWDYRFTWIRDSSFTLYAFLRMGFKTEAIAFMNWLEQRLAKSMREDGSIQIMYGIRGESNLTEQILPHLEGYLGSKPVRIGNGAADQLQLDIYGELMDTVYLCDKLAQPVSWQFFERLSKLVDFVTHNWEKKDDGIWEVRGGAQHFVYSKVMCWVAVDRAIRLAEKRSFPCDIQRWRGERDRIFLTIQREGYNSKLRTYVQSFGSSALDAANLVMPLVFFCAPTDPRFLRTLDATLKRISEGGLTSANLVFRYNPEKTDDGVSAEHEGTFSICTLWAVEALARAGAHQPKYLERARAMFEDMLGFSNHLGLYAEEIGATGEALGNFPQAFTHISLISAAFNLDRVLGSGQPSS